MAGVDPPEKLGGQKLYSRSFFDVFETSKLLPYYYVFETWRRQSGKGVGKHKGLPTPVGGKSR